MKKYLQYFLVTAGLLLCAGLFIYAVIGPRLALYRSLCIEKPVQATGTIMNFEIRDSVTDGIKVQSKYPVVEFTTEDGVKRKFVSTVTARQDMQKGDETEVLFNDKKAVIRREYTAARNGLLLWLGSAVFAVLIITAATLHAFWGKPKREKQKKKRRNPYKKYLWRS